MLQLKLFTGVDIDALQDEVNEWLEDNEEEGDVKIVDRQITLSPSGGAIEFYPMAVISIWYEV